MRSSHGQPGIGHGFIGDVRPVGQPRVTICDPTGRLALTSDRSGRLTAAMRDPIGRLSARRGVHGDPEAQFSLPLAVEVPLQAAPSGRRPPTTGQEPSDQPANVSP